MKILLINPPQTFYKNSQKCVEQLPLGILYIASVLLKEGFDVKVLDALREGDNLVDTGDYTQYGLAWDDISERIRSFKPDIVGISNPYSSQVRNAVKIAEIVKKVDNNIITVMGGAHPTVAYKKLMERSKDIDICIRGEGEYAARDLVKFCFVKREKKIGDIPGIVYRVNNEVVESRDPETIKNLDDLPFPAYELLDMKRYLNARYRLSPLYPETPGVVEIITSRGCPYKCVFCSIRCIMGDKFRAHSAAYVLKHISYILDKYKPAHIRFNDDNISMDMGRFDSIVSGMIGHSLRIKWDCPNGLRVDRMDKDILLKMKKSGCEHIFVAVESGNQDILNRVVKKAINLAKLEEILKICREIKLHTSSYFVLGLPGETLDTMNQSVVLGLKFYEKYDSDPYFFIASPLPGTELLKVCQEKGYLEKDVADEDYAGITQGEPVIHTEEFNPRQVKEIFDNALIRVKKMRDRKNMLLFFIDPFLFFSKVYGKIKRTLVKALRK